MSKGAWGLDDNDLVVHVWRTAPSVAAGATHEGLTVQFPPTDEWASEADIGLKWDGTRVVEYLGTSAERVNAAFRALKVQFEEWESGLVVFGPDVYNAGSAYLNSAWQAAKAILGDSGIAGDEVAEKMFRNALLGALDVTSPAVFADSAYAARNTLPTTAMLWVNSSGDRINLSDMPTHGQYAESLTAERLFVDPPSSAWRS